MRGAFIRHAALSPVRVSPSASCSLLLDVEGASPTGEPIDLTSWEGYLLAVSAGFSCQEKLPVTSRYLCWFLYTCTINI